eukprot:m.329838 g.329838  ORF g.329838 m.329838 type:complete len:413 (-) comp20450_c1_seq27:606-1844(-)
MRNRVRHLAGSTQTQRNGRSNYIDNANALQHTLVQNEWEQKKIGLITTIAVLLTVAAVFSTQVRIAPFARDPGNDREVALRAAASLGERPMLTAQEVVSVSHVRKLWDVGHVTIPGMLTPKVVSLLSPSIESTGMAIVNECARCDSPNDITDHICRGCDRTRETSMVEKSFHKARNLHRVSDVCAAVANSRYLHTIAAKLLNVSRVQLYHDALFIKESGDKESGWHQDSAATPLDTVKIVTIWIALNNIAASAGPLIFAEGSHRSTENSSTMSLRQVPLRERVARMQHYTDEDIARSYKITSTRDLAAGDATAHVGWTLHRAPPNTAHASRKAYAVTYFADGAKVHADLIASTRMHKQPARGISFAAGDGVGVTVQLLGDDISTWVPWMMAGMLTPGQPLNVSAAAEDALPV